MRATSKRDASTSITPPSPRPLPHAGEGKHARFASRLLAFLAGMAHDVASRTPTSASSISTATSPSPPTRACRSAKRSACAPKATRSATASIAISRPNTATASATASTSRSSRSTSRATAPTSRFTPKGQSNGVRVYFGSEATLLAPGEYTYVLRYRTTRQLGFFDDHDELYWNVTGNGWDFPIDAASADVALPGAIARSDHACRRPIPASRARKVTTTPRAPTRRRTRCSATTRALAPREGLTIVVGFPKGIVAAPTSVGARALVPARQRRRSRRRHRPAADVGVLPFPVASRRPRSETRRDHCAVRGAGRLHAGHAAPRRAHGLRRSLLRSRSSSISPCAASSKSARTAAITRCFARAAARAMRCRDAEATLLQATLGSRITLELKQAEHDDDRRRDQAAPRRAREERLGRYFHTNGKLVDSRRDRRRSSRCCSASSRTARAQCSRAPASCCSG